jgi:uncharacterized membrane protein
MTHLESVVPLGGQRSHWVAKGPAGRRIEWEAEVINDITNELIAWRSLAGADVDNAGSVHFDPAPSGRGTVVRVVLQYAPPAGRIGQAVAALWGEEPGIQIEEDLNSLKRLLEAGQTAAEGSAFRERAA